MNDAKLSHLGETSRTVNPTVLIVTTDRWYSAARLAIALTNAGCKVEAICPPGHPVTKTSALHRMYPYSGLTPLKSLEHAIASADPDFIISGNDLATRQLHHLHNRRRSSGKTGRRLCALIERSLGAPESFPIVYARAAFMDLAQEEGIRVPLTTAIQSQDDLRKCAVQMGFPMVLKANGSSGGEGTTVVRTLEEADRAFRKLHSPQRLIRAAKRALLDGDRTLVWPALFRRRPVVNAQAYVAGSEATSITVCWQGKVLASLQFEVLKKRSETGPATVLRLIENREMSDAAEKIVRRLKLSGFQGFDFMVEAQTGHAYLIEINPRTTQVGHLALGHGHDLPSALYAALSGANLPATAKVTENDTIVLFPQEWLRDPASAFLRSGYHDVPWEEPELIRECIRRSQTQRKWYRKQNSTQPSPTIRQSAGPIAARLNDGAAEFDCKRE